MTDMNWSSASERKELEAKLRRIGSRGDAEIDLAEAALLLAALDRPRVPLDRYIHACCATSGRAKRSKSSSRC